MIGKSISHYKILEQIGQGGMGVVYNAEDTKLKRTVALKFLAPELTRDEEAKKRLLYEARAASSLDHANICSIFEIDETDEGQVFIAMAWYDGESLKKRIERGPLKLNEAIDIATQMAAGLQAAHEKGIVHRDIKSANVIITSGGQVKIMDFGLAKISGQTRLTMTGTTMGTVAYMSPEQARGEKVDHRTDIWSMGVVMYEMITGQLPFKGDYEQAIVYGILNEIPEPITGLRTGVPMELERIVNKLIAKSLEDRYQNVVELPVDLKSVIVAKTSSSVISKSSHLPARIIHTPRWFRIVPWVIAVMMTCVALIAFWIKQDESIATSKRLNLVLPDYAPLTTKGFSYLDKYRPALALSPDGSHLAYVADSGGKKQLLLRSLNETVVKPLPGTEGAYTPFFSPKGRWIGFFVENEMKKVSVSGGTPTTICEVKLALGACWTSEDRIIFSNNDASTLDVINTSGELVTQITEENAPYIWLDVLPNARTVLYSGQLYLGIKAVDLFTGETKIILEKGCYPKYVNTGHLLYVLDDRLMAVPFDEEKQSVTGSPISVLEGLRIEANYVAQYAISDDGTLIYVPGIYEGTSTLVWRDRKGNDEELPFPEDDYRNFSLSPDGKRLAIILIRNATQHVYVFDLQTRRRQNLTIEGDYRNITWTPDDQYVTVTRAGKTPTGRITIILNKRFDGSGDFKQILKKAQHLADSWSPDGKLLSIWNPYDILIFNQSDSTLEPFAVDPNYNESQSAFSPNGQWIAYESDEQGEYNIYVEAYPKSGIKKQISTDGGTCAVWSPVSNELFYLNGEKLMRVRYATDPTFTPELPELLFEKGYISQYGRVFDISTDGQRFLFRVRGKETNSYSQLNVVTNWLEELKDKVPKGK